MSLIGVSFFSRYPSPSTCFRIILWAISRFCSHHLQMMEDVKWMMDFQAIFILSGVEGSPFHCIPLEMTI